ncbi:PEPxxWA-CTERM sorting domain-containing protein [Parafrankia sp. BMG5.11]|uniref:PEPxxWA-CTERM sorting domain-containing protein n=1 Tax=Parafrankia sp. BMG5.11 TaxID=222540 RepID=UPI001039B21E|nr:PEPxxWA-CTERM sorting domain-containing protein [Parafrankia sp. BMG5.11]TCJ39503.1 PEP-CTERM sorting domain-containing protein [Parafrankia sp. BMG5.11]
MRYATLALACGASAIFCTPAQAAVTLEPYTIEEGSFGTGLGVHSTGDQEDTTVNGVVNQEGSAVTFVSADVLEITGKGQAVISPLDGTMNDLTVIFANPWDKITFSFDADTDGTFELFVNEGLTNSFDFGTCSICNITASGQNKFTVSGGGITTLGFTFAPGVGTARQFRVDEVSAGPGAVPEPATWAMMLFGFGAVGFGMRRRRSRDYSQARVRYAF